MTKSHICLIIDERGRNVPTAMWGLSKVALKATLSHQKGIFMGDNAYVDLQILAEIDSDEYLVRIAKADLNALVAFDDQLVVRHWDGKQPVVLKAYGKSAVRTQEDADKSNNLVQLPRLHDEALSKLTSS